MLLSIIQTEMLNQKLPIRKLFVYGFAKSGYGKLYNISPTLIVVVVNFR